MAIQIARRLEAYVATTVAAEDFDYAKNLGADEVIDYKNQMFEYILKDYDAVLDVVGGEVCTRSYQILRKGGVIVSTIENPNQELVLKHEVRAIAQMTQVNSVHLAKVAEFVEQGAIKVFIDKTFPLDQAPEAITYLRDSHTKGKVIIKIV